MFVVEFKNLGRSGISLKKVCEEISFENLYDAVKPFLFSRDIGFLYSEETKKRRCSCGNVSHCWGI